VPAGKNFKKNAGVKKTKGGEEQIFEGKKKNASEFRQCYRASSGNALGKLSRRRRASMTFVVMEIWTKVSLLWGTKESTEPTLREKQADNIQGGERGEAFD